MAGKTEITLKISFGCLPCNSAWEHFYEKNFSFNRERLNLEVFMECLFIELNQ
jgi:hypothetical protein